MGGKLVMVLLLAAATASAQAGTRLSESRTEPTPRRGASDGAPVSSPSATSDAPAPTTRIGTAVHPRETRPPSGASHAPPSGAEQASPSGIEQAPPSAANNEGAARAEEGAVPDSHDVSELRAQAGDGPRFVKVLPARHNRDEIEATVGRELRLAFVVEHPRGLPMQVKALGLPHRATFDAQLRSIVWRPTEAELGVYQVRVVASDGIKEASHTLLIAVVPNRPPVVGSLWFEAVVGQPSAFLVQAHDPEQSAVQVQLDGLPPGARFDTESGRLRWVPTKQQVGTHSFVVRASDGQAVTVANGKINVLAGRVLTGELQEWTSYLLPGFGYSLYAPRNSDLADVYHGVNLEFLLAAWIHRNDHRGPSHGRIYLNVELLDAIDADAPLMFTYSGGLSLSFERNPQRTWLVPHYGVEVGGMIHRELGAHFQATPYLGLHVYATPRVFLGARAGYRLVPRRIDELAGLHAGLNVNFSIW